MANGTNFPYCGGCKYLIRAEPPLVQLEKDCCALHQVMLTRGKNASSVLCVSWSDRKESGETLGLWLEHMDDPEMLYEFAEYSMPYPQPFIKLSELKPCPQDMLDRPR